MSGNHDLMCSLFPLSFGSILRKNMERKKSMIWHGIRTLFIEGFGVAV